jgi:type I restriction enzyme M protein
VLRLPNGTFSPYSAGTKTNVVFFTQGAVTETVWVFDARTNVSRVTKRTRPLSRAHLAAFEACYGDDPYGRGRRSEEAAPDGRFRAFSLAELEAREFKIDGLRWLREGNGDADGAELSAEDLAAGAIAELEEAARELASVIDLLARRGQAERPRVVRGGGR